MCVCVWAKGGGKGESGVDERILLELWYVTECMRGRVSE